MLLMSIKILANFNLVVISCFKVVSIFSGRHHLDEPISFHALYTNVPVAGPTTPTLDAL